MNIFMGRPSTKIQKWLVENQSHVQFKTDSRIQAYKAMMHELQGGMQDGQQIGMQNSIDDETIHNADVRWIFSGYGAELSAVKQDAFQNCGKLLSIELYGVEEVGDRSFKDCTSLSTVLLPDVWTIGDEAFQGCWKLEDVSILNATELGARCFEDCSSLVRVDVPAVQKIAEGTFQGCSSLSSADCGNAWLVESDAFKDCTALVSVDLENAETIGDGAFQGCTSLSDVQLDNAYEIGAGAFKDCTALVSVDLDNVETLGDGAFQGCTSLSLIELASIKTIGKNAFADCPTDIVIDFGSTSYISMIDIVQLSAEWGLQSGFQLAVEMVMVPALEYLTQPSNNRDKTIIGLKEDLELNDCIQIETDQYGTFTQWVVKRKNQNLLDSYATSISGQVFDLQPLMQRYNRYNPDHDIDEFLESVSLKSVKMSRLTYATGYGTFRNNTFLSSAEFPILSSICESFMQSCASISSLSLPKLENTARRSFYGCSALTSVYMPELTSAGYGSFSYAPLSSIAFDKLETADEGAFSYMSLLETVSLPSVSEVGVRAFYSDEKLEYVRLPNALSIGEYAFRNCPNLKEIVLPKATYIGDHAFWQCGDSLEIDLSENPNFSQFNDANYRMKWNVPVGASIYYYG